MENQMIARHVCATIVAVFACYKPSYVVSDALDGLAVEVVGTQFQVVGADGERLTGRRLVGMQLNVTDRGGESSTVRIDNVLSDPRDIAGDLTLYEFSVRNKLTGFWENLCAADADGFAGGFPLGGTWTPTGEHKASEHAFSIACTSGVRAKCVRMGYKPWKAGPDGKSLWDLHQACTRMLRADYCGNGTPHTRNGTPVEVYDSLGIQTPTSGSGLSFEAVWGPNGAICVRKLRLADPATPDALLSSCPRSLRIGEACKEDEYLGADPPVIINRS